MIVTFHVTRGSKATGDQSVIAGIVECEGAGFITRITNPGNISESEAQVMAENITTVVVEELNRLGK